MRNIRGGFFYKIDAGGTEYRLHIQPPDILTFTDSQNRSLSNNDSIRKKLGERNLQEIDLRLLRFLIDEPNQFHSIRAIDNKVWGKLPKRLERRQAAKKDSDPESKIRTRISNLRKALGDDRYQLIQTGPVADDDDSTGYGFFGRAELVLTSATIATTQQTLSEPEEMICPYQGLSIFDEAHASFFKGREKVTDELQQAIEQQPLVTLTSASGIGKSSVIFAGLLPRLRQQGNWLIIAIRPQVEPFQSLSNALIPFLEPTLPPDRLQRKAYQLIRDLRNSRNHFRYVLEQLRQKGGDDRRLLLVIDQFEELFDDHEQGIKEQENIRRRFIDSLLDVMDYCRRSGGQARLLIALRVDFLERLSKNQPLTFSISRSDLRLKPMDRNEMQEAIILPAQEVGLEIEAGLDERILDDLGEQAGGLPLLEFTLEQLWHKREGKKLTHSAYKQIGRINKAVADYADNFYRMLSNEQQSQFRKIVLKLIAVNSRESYYIPSRRTMTRDQMDTQEWDVVTRLTDARLLITSRDPLTNRETVEIIHEALITAWPRFEGWVKEHHSFLVWRDQLDLAHKKYQQLKKTSDLLLRGHDLKESIRWLKETQRHSTPYSINNSERDFIISSQRRQKSIKRQKWFGGISLLAIFIAVSSIAFWGYNLYSARKLEALAQKLLSLSLAIRNDRPDLLSHSVLLSLEAYKRRPSPDAYQAIYEGLSFLPKLRFSLRDNSIATYTEDGRHIITRAKKQSIKIWDANSGQELKSFDFPINIENMAATKDGRYLALACENRTVLIADGQTGKLLAEIPHPENVREVVFSPDGKYLASMGAGQDILTVHVWSVPDGTKVSDLGPGDGILQKVTFSSDSRYLAFAANDYEEHRHSSASVWEVKTGREIFHLPHTAIVMDVKFSPDGRYLATGGKECILRIWDLDGGREVHHIDQKEPINTIDFSQDGKLLITGNELYLGRRAEGYYTSHVFDFTSGHEVSRFRQEEDVHNVAFSPDGKFVVSGSYSPFVQDQKYTARVWEANTGRELARTFFESSVAATFSPNGKFVLTEGALLPAPSPGAKNGRNTEESEIDLVHTTQVWDPFDPPLEVARLNLEQSNIQGHSISSNGRYLAVATERDNSISVRELSEMKEISSIHCPGNVFSMAVSNDGKFVAASIGSWPKHENIVYIWSMETHKALFTEPHADSVTNMQFSPSGRYLAEVDRGVQIIDVAEGKEKARLEHKSASILSMSFSPDGQYIVTGGNDNIRVWDASSWSEISAFEYNGGIPFLSVSPDGRSIAAATGKAGEIKIFGLTNHNETRITQKDAVQMQGLEFSPDGTYLKIVDENFIVHFWDVRTKQEIARIKKPDTHPIFRYDGLLVILGKDIFTVEKWLPDDVFKEVCSRLTRNLTPEEWAKYLPEEPYQKTCASIH